VRWKLTKRGLTQYNLLMLAIGNLFWVPFSVKFGKRPVLLVCMFLLMCSQIWSAEAGSYGSLLGARVVCGFAAAAGEVSQPLPACHWPGFKLDLLSRRRRVLSQPSSRTSFSSTNVPQ
jgi:MFS family permease